MEERRWLLRHYRYLNKMLQYRIVREYPNNYAHNREPGIDLSRKATLQSFRKVRATPKREHAHIPNPREDFHLPLNGE